MKVLAWPARNDLNPYVALTYSRFVPPRATVANFRFGAWKQTADVFHIHWPEAIFWGHSRLPFSAVLRALKVLLATRHIHTCGGLVALTLHNLAPHQGMSKVHALVWKYYQRMLLARTDLLISLSHDALTMYRAANPAMAKVPAVVVPHPHYRSHYGAKPTVHEARAALGVSQSKKIVGVIGSMRASKMIPATIDIFRKIAHSDELLFIAGGCDDSHWQEIQAACAGDERVLLRRGVLSEEQLAAAVTACNVILLNQAEMLNSGTALLALSFDKPLIAVAVGSMKELAGPIGPDWLKLFDKPLDGRKLREAMDATWRKSLIGSAPIDHLDPDALSELLLDVFQNHMPSKSKSFGLKG